VAGHSLGGWAAVLAAAADPRLRAVAIFGAAVELGVLDLDASQVEHELTRFLATTPEEFVRQREEVTARMGPVDAVPSISPRPLLVVHGTDDRWIPAEHARRLHARAGQPSRYVEIDGANHDFAWHRGQLRELVCSWLDGAGV
jgi:pimeloyl-ACP methyl ester carboxylesterase